MYLIFMALELTGISDGKDFIKIQSPGNKEYNLVFRTYRDAVAFYEWLADYFDKAENRNKIS